MPLSSWTPSIEPSGWLNTCMASVHFLWSLGSVCTMSPKEMGADYAIRMMANAPARHQPGISTRVALDEAPVPDPQWILEIDSP